MAWTTPATFVATNILTAAQLNTNVRDNANALYGGGLALASQAAGDWMQASSATAWVRTKPFSPLLYSGTTPADNTSTGETDLMSVTLAAGLLSTNGWGVEVVAAFTFVNNANAKTIKFKFGTPTIVAIAGATSQAYSQIVRATILRVSATAQIIEYMTTAPGGIGATVTSATAAGVETMANSLALKFTGQGGATSDISQVLMTATLIHVP